MGAVITHKKNQPLIRNLAAGIVGLAAAAALVLVTLRLQDYGTPAFLMVALFIFPVPVACGLAVGLVSPRRAIVWAPLWASIFTLLLFAVLPGGIHDASLALSGWRVGFTIAGVGLAALAGLAGQEASRRGLTKKTVACFVALCCLMALAEYLVIGQSMHEFERTVRPQVLWELDRDYLQVPKDALWTCTRSLRDDCYLFSARIRGARLSVLVATDAPRITGVRYRLPGSNQSIRTTDQALAYLRSLGFRPALLASLSRNRGDPRTWVASLSNTRLTLSHDGAVRVEILSDLLRAIVTDNPPTHRVPLR